MVVFLAEAPIEAALIDAIEGEINGPAWQAECFERIDVKQYNMTFMVSNLV